MSLAAYNSAFGAVKIVRTDVDDETVRVLEVLLSQAKAGKVYGVAVVSITGPKEYDMQLTGQAQDRPTFTLGALTKFKLLVADMLGD